MTRRILRRLVLGLVLLTAVPRPAQAQIPVYDAAVWYQTVLELAQLSAQLRLWIQQARRLPGDLVSRYRSTMVPWTTHDLRVAMLYARQMLTALNAGDPTGVAYRQSVDPLDRPTDILSRMPPALQRRLTNAYAAVETADSVATLAVDQMGAMRRDGPRNEQVARLMELDAVATSDDYHTQIAVLNKINAATALGLRFQDHISKALVSTLEQAMVANARQRDVDALLLNAGILQWRYGRTYGEGVFTQTAAAIDGWRMP